MTNSRGPNLWIREHQRLRKEKQTWADIDRMYREAGLVPLSVQQAERKFEECGNVKTKSTKTHPHRRRKMPAVSKTQKRKKYLYSGIRA